jgi:predicted nucleic acid-binding protein
VGRALTAVVFLDASAIIYLVEAVEPWGSAIEAVLRAALQADPAVALAVSAISRLECRVLPLRKGDRRLLAQFDMFFGRQDLIVVPLSMAVIDGATEVRATVGLGTPDALQAASCLSLGDNGKFVTADPVFRRVGGLNVFLM